MQAGCTRIDKGYLFCSHGFFLPISNESLYLLTNAILDLADFNLNFEGFVFLYVMNHTTHRVPCKYAQPHRIKTITNMVKIIFATSQMLSRYFCRLMSNFSRGTPFLFFSAPYSFTIRSLFTDVTPFTLRAISIALSTAF